MSGSLAHSLGAFKLRLCIICEMKLIITLLTIVLLIPAFSKSLVTPFFSQPLAKLAKDGKTNNSIFFIVFK